jgi:hypothetical protein
MLKPTKKEKKLLKNLAKELPETMYRANQSRLVSPEEMLRQRGEVIPAGTLAQMTKSVMVPVNHERRMVKAYEQGGMEAVKEYVRGVMELVKNNLSPVNLGSQL